MRYKTLITQKLQQVENGIKQLRYHAERDEMSEFRSKQEPSRRIGRTDAQHQSYLVKTK